MVAKALFVRLEAQRGKEDELEELLRGGLEAVRGEPGTVHWFAAKIGESSFAIFDTFNDDAGKMAHLQGQVVAALASKGAELLAAAPKIEHADVLATKG
ncbi:MAG TPA: antibiotic biosynthesis monooxygenase [Phenylobacterium sp.]